MHAVDFTCEVGLKPLNVEVYGTLQVMPGPRSLQVWLLLDGMVLDVGRWLPEHPGGATIIPAQSLNCDCSRFFEVRT
jgi:cytochrome b involved in lipid metabolism